MKSTLDIAHECGAAYVRQWDCNEIVHIKFTPAQLDDFAERIRAAAEGECKPSLYLFWSAHGGIRYWTRDAAAAARKAIEFGTEPERLYAATVPASVQLVALPAGMPEPDAYMFQHEETGLVQFVDAQQVEWGFEESNPRLKRIDAVYTAAQVRAMLAPVRAPVQTAAQYLSGSDMADLQQLDADFSDGEGWCLPKARMTRLAELGVIRHGGGGNYSITSFGSLILGGGFFRLPLETVEECNARIGKEHNGITAQQGGAA